MPTFKRSDIRIKDEGKHDSWTGRAMLTARVRASDGTQKMFNWYATRTRCEIRTLTAAKMIRAFHWTEVDRD